MTYLDPGARMPVNIEVRTRPQTFDPESLPDWKPQQNAAPTGGEIFDPEKLEQWKPQPAPSGPAPTGSEAAGLGIGESLTFGTAPMLEGLASAAGPEWNQSQAGHDLAPIIGAGKMIGNMLSGHPDERVRDAYERGRKEALARQKQAGEQHPWAYGAGQLAGALMTPIPGLGGGATMVGRLGRAALAGGTAGGLYSAGSATSEERPIGEIATETAKGAGVGAAFGGLASGAIEGLGRAGAKALSIGRGARDVDQEAGRRVAAALQSDFEREGQKFTPEMVQAGNEAGIPRSIVDVGGERTRALARSAANTSPEARSALEEMTRTRFEQQSPRIAGYIRRITGGSNAGDDMAALEQAARTANRPAYARAYAAGDKEVWSPELERLTAAPYVQRALSGAVSKWKNYAVRDGYGAMNPPFRVENGGLIKQGGGGLKAYPNIQLWDYAARELQDRARSAPPGSQQASLYNDLARGLKNELDRIVPEYGAARGTARTFFGAENALEAGQKFVMSNASIPEARRALAQMSPAERELFARGFASDLADRIERTGDRRNVINSIFVGSGVARQKIEMALGTNRARQVETVLRVESLVDEARKALGNSTTARQIAESGLAGGGAVAAFEGIKEHEFNPSHIVAAALVGGVARHGAKVIDERVARRVGEMLASNDPDVLQKGITIVTKSPVLFDAVRTATGAVARTATHKLGLPGAVGLGSMLLGGPEHEGASAADLLSDQQQ